MSAPLVQEAVRPVASARVALLRYPLAVGSLVMLLYALWFGAYAIAGYSAHDLILISKKYATQSHKSSVITYEPHRVGGFWLRAGWASCDGKSVIPVPT